MRQKKYNPFQTEVISEDDNFQFSTFNFQLIKWYNENKRELPWRETTDPYKIWISEIILQQTRVNQGYDYFLRFIKRFPDVQTLANADEDEVMKYWQGLGYYSRARNLHAAAKSMNGVFPDTYEGVINLKGVGEYTAAAICSISYGMPYPVVDGNVFRVISRYMGVETPIDSGRGKKEITEWANRLMDKKQPALFNQAIMDFGALLCTPKSPDCTNCPLANRCVALAVGLVNKLPIKQHKTKTTNRYFNYLYVNAGEYTFIHKRTGNDIWRNLFELPLIETSEPVTEENLIASTEFRNLIAEGESPVIKLSLKSVKHVLSHRVIYANFYEVTLPETTRSFSTYKRIKKEDMDQYAISRLVQIFLES
ncbi:A/G-specific adenine glycosylase [Bacteroides sp. 51]|uniref:A/G-specific adenine glycosylase n=1 Tax=Bacteroides sp. 51 TaxID=2302938 RepID=UPI0013D121CD|nr:A/G-specific adenine glycosylase [Bacteroides sp. 51]NDV81848.1 A/G-specific adenine glycosylase [Bacteroides sp. 51]